MLSFKKIASCVLTAAVCVSMLTACADSSSKDSGSENSRSESSGPKSETMHKLYVRDENKSDEITVIFENTSSGETETVEMEKISESDDYATFSCEGDTALYNRVYITRNGSKNLGVAFNKYVSGWSISSYGLIPYTEGEELANSFSFKTETFDYKGNKKEVYIWTPKDYDPRSKEKYSTVYLLDGETKLSPDFSYAQNNGCWYAPASVTSMMLLSNNKAIIVAISNLEETRYDELVPDIGELLPDNTFNSNKDGKPFCEFVVNTVVPFIEKNYNVYTDAAHNSIGGGSLAGLESFYIGMEHPEKFGAIGAFSPTFGALYTSSWKEYLSKKKFDDNSPFIYFYSGDAQDNEWSAKGMIKCLQEINYPSSKMAYTKYPKGMHSVPYWRNIFPEYLEAAFDKKVAALEGKPLIDENETIPYYDTK